jgi:hypothetical protein
MISAKEIDQLLLAFCDTRWRKIARVIGASMDILMGCRIRPSGTLAKIIDMRMAALVRSGRLEAEGDIRKWRYSEVRLPTRKSKGQNKVPLSLLRKKLPNGNGPGKRKRRTRLLLTMFSVRRGRRYNHSGKRWAEAVR